MRIIFFIDSLRAGGKERRIVELLHYLIAQPSYELHLVSMEKDIHYRDVYRMGIPITIIERRRFKKDPFIFVKFYNIVKKFRPDIIHTWGVMPTFYAIPAKIFLHRPIVANLISNSQKDFKPLSLYNFFFHVDCFFSERIIGNSNAGFLAYGFNSQKRRLIYNGVWPERFQILADKQEIKNQIGVRSKHMVIMVASMNKNKNYDLFLDTAKEISMVNGDVTLVAVGNGSEYRRIQSRIAKEEISNVILLGQRDDVESLIYASDLGVLFTYSEGISNAIIEYMASGKPVITTDKRGGSRELIKENVNGYIADSDAGGLASLILEVLKDEVLKDSLGEKGRAIIQSRFTIARMGREYDCLYHEASGCVQHARRTETDPGDQ